MASFLVDEKDFQTTLDALTDSKRREIRRKMVENGAKVLVKEMQAQIEERHHVVNRYMKNSVAPGEVKEDLDGTSIYVGPGGTDPRGVSNEMKARYIIQGHRSIFSGQKLNKTDNFLNDAFRKKCEPRIYAVMNATFNICMEELNK